MNNPVASQPSTTSLPANGAEPPPHPGYDAPVPARQPMAAPIQTFQGGRSQATQVEQARAIAEVQGAIMVAQERPRDEARAIARMREVCNITGLAERAFFSFSRGGGNVTGASVHLARELGRCWGNIDYGVKELSRNDARGESEMLAFAWDLETNTRNETTFIVPHMRDKKGGPVRITDMRDIYENNANMGARRVRECVFAILPKWFTDDAEDRCRATLKHGGGKPLPQRRADLVAAFEQLGVTKAMIEKRENTVIDNLIDTQIANLGIVYRSLKNNEIGRDEAFPETPAADVDAHLRAKAAQTGGPSPAMPGSAGPAPSETKPQGTDSGSSAPATTEFNAKAVTDLLMKKIVAADKVTMINAIEIDYAVELNTLESAEPEMYAKVQAALDGKRDVLGKK